MVAVSVSEGAALKEWAAVVKALESGEQILVLRKGGIREEGFDATAETFFLYPTGFHQTGDKLRLEHAHFLEEAMAEKPPEGIVRIGSFGQVVETFSVSSEKTLERLAPEYIYTVDELKKKFSFRPGESLTALAVRVYRLPRAVDLPVKTQYGGCVSWIRLQSPVPTENARPALTEEAFNRKLSAVRIGVHAGEP
ncbi:DUF1802 family protein [bacterium]|nr:DUF1802 family protein [bacterium]